MASRGKKTKLANKKLRYGVTALLIGALILILPRLSEDLQKYFSLYRDDYVVSPAEGELSVHFIDVGQGDSALILAPGGEVMLIDSGTSDSQYDLLQYLRLYQVERIDYFVLTHPHADHIGGASAVFDAFEVSCVIMPDAVTDTSTYRNVLKKIDAEGCDVLFAEPDGRTHSLGAASFVLLGPTENYGDELNDSSVVLRLDYASAAFLFTGDAEARSEADMLERFPADAFDADVLKLGHHGSSTSTSEEWLDAVSPQFAVVSCGKNNEYGHPHSEILSLLTSRGVGICRTDRNGTVVFTTDGSSVTLRSPATPTSTAPTP